ncbi:MAG TPA: bifunctional serine/threonine-protein kinase/ABC transporter substrate-binding protein [Candidatus Eremiobacteraeota bacterium]|nr:bifunctional serine/threonine-protein kinase/ABC transporter substrate-binding protein [Candidatus Eremiobacteraeota bacterium]
MLSQGNIIKSEYSVIKIIGSGGMGAIYLCSEVNNPDKLWAIKEMQLSQLQGEMQEKALKQFEMEAEILSKLNHIHLPKVKEYFKENSNYYLVMEFVEGEDLGKLLSKNPEPFSDELVLKWGTQIATALYFLHIQKPHPIIYRDIKPSNIIITPGGNIKLVDFGIARFFQPGKKKDTVQMGSLGYAPPEQFGEGQTDERSDIYALGVTLHQLLTKRDPAEADNPFKIPLVRTLNNKVSIELERLIQRATQFESARRYQQVSELKKDLKSLYDERLRKSSILSIQPPTIAITSVETERLPLLEKISSDSLPQENKQGVSILQKVSPHEAVGAKISETNKEEKKIEEKSIEKDLKVEADKKQKSKSKKNISSGKKKFFHLKGASLLIFLFIFFALGGGGYYLYRYPEKTPPWLLKYLSFIPDTSITPLPEATSSPSLFQDALKLKEKGIIKYREGKFSEAMELIKKFIEINPYDPEAMIIKSNIELALNGTKNFSIGLIVSKTGKYSMEGNAVMKGAFLGLKEINSNWGIRGKMLKLDILDDTSDLNLAVNYPDMTAEDLTAFIGPDEYILDLTLAPIVKNNGIIQFSPTLPMLSPSRGRPFTFGLSPDRKSEVKAIINLICENMNKKDITSIYDVQNPYFFELNYIFKEEILTKERNINGNEILIRGDNIGEKREVARVLSILEKEKTDVIVFFTSSHITKQIASEIRKKNKDVVFITGHWGISGYLLEDENLDGLICLSPSDIIENENFVKNYKEVFSDNSLIFLTRQTYDALLLLKEAIEIKGFRREDIKSYILKFDKNKPYPGKSGKLYFSGQEGEREFRWKALQIINRTFHIHISDIKG